MLKRQKLDSLESVFESYNNYKDLKSEITTLKEKILHLEKDLQDQKDLKSSIAEKLVYVTNELKHSKIKHITENKLPNIENNDLKENFYEANVNLLQKNANYIKEIRELSEENKQLKNMNDELQSNVDLWKCKCVDFQEIEDKLHDFINENQEKIENIKQLESKINDLKTQLEISQPNEVVCRSILKLKEYEDKFSVIEEKNAKLQKTHTNLMLLMEENENIKNQLNLQNQQLEKYQNLNNHTVVDSNKDCFYDFLERKNQFLMKQNEIYKTEITRNHEKINELSNELKSADNKSNRFQIKCEALTAENKAFKQRIDMSRSSVQQLQKENECYAQLLSKFSEESLVLDGDCKDLHTALTDLYAQIDNRTLDIDDMETQFNDSIDQLQSTIESINNYSESMNINADAGFSTNEESNEMLVEDKCILLNQIDDKIDEMSQCYYQLQELQDSIANTNNTPLSSDIALQTDDNASCGDTEESISQAALCKYGFTRDSKYKSEFTKLTDKLMFAVESLLGYKLTIHTDALVTVESTNTGPNARSETVLEFIVNATEQQIEFKPSYHQSGEFQTLMNRNHGDIPLCLAQYFLKSHPSNTSEEINESTEEECDDLEEESTEADEENCTADDDDNDEIM